MAGPDRPTARPPSANDMDRLEFIPTRPSIIPTQVSYGLYQGAEIRRPVEDFRHEEQQRPLEGQ